MMNIRIYSLFSLLLISAGMTVAAQTPSSGSPTPDQRFETARQAALDGDHQTAANIYRQLLAGQPDNVDYLLGLGQTLLWQNRPDQAIPYLQRGVELAPDYADLHSTLYQALSAAGREDEAESIRTTAAARFNNPPWTRVATETPDQVAGINLQLSNQLEFPGPGQSDWRYTTMELGVGTERHHRYGVQLQNAERFGHHDMTYSANGYYRFSDNTGVFASAGYSPTHRVMPRHNLNLQLSHSLGNGWGGIVGVKHTGYNESDVITTDITLERYLGDFRLAYTLIKADADITGITTGHRLQLGRYFVSESHIQLSYTTGEEIEKPTAAEVLISSSIDTLAIWGEVRLTPSFGLLYSLGKTWIDPASGRQTDREFFSLGINYYF